MTCHLGTKSRCDENDDEIDDDDNNDGKAVDLPLQGASRPGVSGLVCRNAMERKVRSAKMVPRYDRTPRPRECIQQLLARRGWG